MDHLPTVKGEHNDIMVVEYVKKKNITSVAVSKKNYNKNLPTIHRFAPACSSCSLAAPQRQRQSCTTQKFHALPKFDIAPEK